MKCFITINNIIVKFIHFLFIILDTNLFLKAMAFGIDVVLDAYRQKLVTVEQKVY